MEENNNVKQDVEKKKMEPKTKKIMTFSIIGGVALIAIIVIIALIVGLSGKPSKGKAQDLVKSYLSAVENADEDKFEKIIDTKGYIIFKEEEEKKFDTKYKNKDKYIKDYLEDRDYDDLSDAKDSILSSLKSRYSYSSKEYSLKEITSIKKSSKSKKISIIKAKVKVKSKYSSTSDTKNLKLYVVKVDGQYKVVGADLES